MKKITAAITGVGAYLPEYILDNFELSKMVDTSDEWIMTRVGIKTRRILKGEGLGTSYMTEKAVNDLLEKTNTDPLDIDMIICATVTPDMFFPSTANLTAAKCGSRTPSVSIFSQPAADLSLPSSRQPNISKRAENKKVIVVGGDKMSSIIDRPTGLPCPFSATVQRQYSLNPTQKDTASSTPSPEATATGASIST